MSLREPIGSALFIARMVLRAAERLLLTVNLSALKGHDFSRAVNAAKSIWALAPEGMLVL
jgi:hypothetical protein